jgi:cell division protein FtsN
MLLGLTMGLVVAGYVYVSDVRAPAPLAVLQARTPTPRPADAATAQPERQPQAAPAARPAPEAQPASDRFQFYETLPQSEVVVPAAGPAREGGAAQGPGPSTPQVPARIEEPGSYVLQAGSFRTHADADRRKASVALLGYESAIERATVDGELRYRVLVGPTNDLNELDVARRRLRDDNIETLVMKARSNAP